MKNLSQLSLLFCLVIEMALSVGCAKKPNDARISSDVQSKYSQDSGLSSKQLTVRAENGVVTLEGNVDNDAQREAAARQAASVAGVKEVINNLQVGSVPVAESAPPQVQDPSKPSPDTPQIDRTRASKRSKARARNPESDDAAVDSGPHQMSADNRPPDAVPAPPASAPNVTPATQPPQPQAPKKLIIDQGTQLAIRLVDGIDSEKNQTGDTFHATLNAALTSDGEEAVPTGSDITGHLVEVKSAGKFAGQSVVVLQLDSLTSGGKTYTLQTDQYRKQGSSRGKNTAEKVGGGAIIGGIIGAIAGGGKGAAIGSAAGAGVGGGVQAASKSQQIKLPSETVLNFTLQAPITVVQARNPDANRPRLTDSPQ